MTQVTFPLCMTLALTPKHPCAWNFCCCSTENGNKEKYDPEVNKDQWRGVGSSSVDKKRIRVRSSSHDAAGRLHGWLQLKDHLLSKCFHTHNNTFWNGCISGLLSPLKSAALPFPRSFTRSACLHPQHKPTISHVKILHLPRTEGVHCSIHLLAGALVQSLWTPAILSSPYKATNPRPCSVVLEFLSAVTRPHDVMEGHACCCPARGSQMVSISSINHTVENILGQWTGSCSHINPIES